MLEATPIGLSGGFAGGASGDGFADRWNGRFRGEDIDQDCLLAWVITLGVKITLEFQDFREQ